MADTEKQPSELGYEPSDVNLRGLWRPLLGLGALIAVTFVLGLWIVEGLVQFRTPQPAETGWIGRREASQVPPLPRLQIAPDQDLAKLRREEDRLLETYAWINEPEGLARIPIERAMAILANEAEGGGS